MDTKVEKLKDARIRTTTIVTKEEVTKAEAAALAHLAERVNIQGFRPGKAPANMVRERVGEDMLLEETVRSLLPTVMKDALEKSGAKPILRPAAGVTSKDPLTITLTFVERPKVTLKKPDGIKVEKKSLADATPEDVETFIKKVLMHDRTETDVERAAGKGDLVRLALSAKDKDGKQVDELTVGNYTLTLGAEELLPELEAHATGMKKDEKKTVDIAFKADHDIPSVRGKKIKVELHAKSIAEPKLPELTAEYLKSRLKTDKTPEAFRSDVKDMLSHQKRDAEYKRREDELYEKVRTAVQTDLPQELVEAEVQDMVQDLTARLEKQGMTMDQWMQSSGKDAKTVVDEMRGIGSGRVTLRLGMQELAKHKNIDATEAEMTEAIAEVRKEAALAGRHLSEEDVKTGGPVHENIKFDLIMQKLIKNMIEEEKK